MQTEVGWKGHVTLLVASDALSTSTSLPPSSEVSDSDHIMFLQRALSYYRTSTDVKSTASMDRGDHCRICAADSKTDNVTSHYLYLKQVMSLVVDRNVNWTNRRGYRGCGRRGGRGGNSAPLTPTKPPATKTATKQSKTGTRTGPPPNNHVKTPSVASSKNSHRN